LARPSDRGGISCYCIKSHKLVHFHKLYYTSLLLDCSTSELAGHPMHTLNIDYKNIFLPLLAMVDMENEFSPIFLGMETLNVPVTNSNFARFAAQTVLPLYRLYPLYMCVRAYE
jgi:hypothetical protein